MENLKRELPKLPVELSERITDTVHLHSAVIVPYGLIPVGEAIVAYISIGDWSEPVESYYVTELVDLVDAFDAKIVYNVYNGELAVEIDAETAEEARKLAEQFLEKYNRIF